MGFARCSYCRNLFTGPQDAAPVDERKEGEIMRIFTSEPLSSFRNRLRNSLYGEDLLDEIVFEEMWLPYGDDKETDIHRLVKQHRLRK